MKSIVYILLAVFISSIFMTSIPVTLFAGSQKIRIECTDSIMSSNQLTESGKIIKLRLQDYGIEHFNVKVINAEKSIEITLQGKLDGKEALRLFTATGKLEFYEMAAANKVVQTIHEPCPLYSLLNIPSQENALFDPNSIVLGYALPENMFEVNNLIRSLTDTVSELSEFRFLWGSYPETIGAYNLYVLQKTPGLSGNIVSECYASADGMNMQAIHISFNKEGKGIWENLTQNNIGKAIAIVLDDKVYSAPRVMDTIKGGQCMITGNFSANEARLLASLINNQELPLHFKVVKF